MNGKPRDMDYKFAIKVLNSAKVETPSMRGNLKHYGYQNQTFYDIARRMAVKALKEKYESNKPMTNYDRIKAKIANMEVDEISKFLSKSGNCEKYCAYTEDGLCNKFENDGQGGCVDGVKQWLESEVSE